MTTGDLDQDPPRQTPPRQSDDPPVVTATLQAVDRRWRARGVPRADRARMAADLRVDLLAVHAEQPGHRTPTQLLGAAPAQFADDLARAAGATAGAARPTRLWRSAAIGAALGALIVYVGVFDGTRVVPGLDSLTIVFAFYAGLGVCFVGAVLAAAWLGTRAEPLARSTVGRAALLLPLSAAVSVPLAVGIAHLVHYAINPVTLLAEGGVVLALAGAAIHLAHWSALRSADAPPPTGARP